MIPFLAKTTGKRIFSNVNYLYEYVFTIYNCEDLKGRINMYSCIIEYLWARVTVAYRFMGRRTLRDKLARCTEGNRWRARHLTCIESLYGSLLVTWQANKDLELHPYYIDSVFRSLHREQRVINREDASIPK